MKFLLKYNYFVYSLTVLCCLFSRNIQAYSLPLDYQKKLLMPEPILELCDSSFLQDTAAISQIKSYVYKGDSLFLEGKLNSAVSVYKEVLAFTEKSGNIWLTVLLDNRIGFTSYWLLDFQAAGDAYLQSLELITRSSEIRDTLLVLEPIIFFRKCNDMLPVTKHEYSLSALIDYITIEPVNMNPVRKAKYHLLQALWYSEETDFFEEKRELKNAEKQLISGSYGQDFWLFLIRYYLASYYIRLGDYKLADEFVSELALQVKNVNRFNHFKYYIYSYQCDLSARFKDFKTARYYADKLAPFITGRQHPYFYYDNIIMGYVYQETGDYEKAQKYFLWVKELLDINHIENERLAVIYWYLARFYRIAFFDDKKCLHYLRLAETVLNEHADLYLESFVYSELGNYYYREKDFDLAIMFYNILLDDLDQLLSDEEYFKSKYPYLVRSRYLYTLGRRAKAFYYLSKSKDYDLVTLRSSYHDFKDLLRMQQKIYEEIGYEVSRISVLQSLRSTSNSLLNVGYTLLTEINDDSLREELFEILQGTKAYIFKKYISDELAKRMAGIPEELIDQSKNLQKEIDTLQYSFHSADIHLGKQRENLLVNKILNKQDEYREFIRKLESEYPKYAELKKSSRKISMEDIQKKLQETQAFIDYHYNQNSLYLFYIDKDTIQIVYQPVDMKFPYKIMEYRQSLEEMKFGDFDVKTIREFADRSYEIYNLVLQPVKKNIQKKRLIIVPDGELNFIPFESLVTEDVDTSLAILNYNDLNYLVFHNPVSYLYSASQIFDNHNFPSRKVRFAGFAPDYSKLHDGVGQLDSIYADLSELPGAYNEVLSAVKYFKGNLYTGENLKKNQFFKANVRNDIVHLAMHTIIDEDEPMNSELIISTNPQRATQQLRAYEVYSRRNSTSLVVLSACNTGAGKFLGGEGVFSIARAFLLSGVYNVVFTHWPVADRSSATLMDRYYYYLSNGSPTDVALQQSKIDFLTYGDPVKAHPSYWSAYVNVGNPFSFPEKNKFRYIWVLVLAVTTGFLYFIFRNRSKHS